MESLRAHGRAYRPTHVINCAAYTAVDRAEEEPEQAFAVNAEGAENVGRTALELGARLLHLSTDDVFGGYLDRPFREDDPCRPIGVYGRSKREGEERLLDVFPRACIVRTSWIFGPGGKNFLSSLPFLLRTQEEVRATAEQVRRATYVRDLAAAVLDLLCHTGVYHVASHGETTRYHMAVALLRAVEKEQLPVVCRRIVAASVRDFPKTAPRSDYSVLDTRKAEGVLGKTLGRWQDRLKEYMTQCAF
jgi:dTDP-4-dehydrorhamnose reductase